MGHLIDFWKSRLIDFWQSCHLKKPGGHPGEYSDVSSVPRQLCPSSLYSDLSVVQVLHSTVICLGILQYTHINGLDALLIPPGSTRTNTKEEQQQKNKWLLKQSERKEQ